ncbi:hypothetical protein [Arenimonas sp.]|uniref:hypothetical protein n=1 Tax=Arenimonas sp. TaxID=1872635 RepID=UPI002E33F22B|nr:hypothetical protein [Arenimonas sp.]HEX4853935.1 hypothetical protein [Arenimonas sp.]
MTPRLPLRALLALLLFALALVACKRETPADQARAPGDPVEAVETMAAALRQNDLVRYGHLSLPPDLHARSAALWDRRAAEAEPASDEDAEKYDRLMARLLAPNAEEDLARDLDQQLARLEQEIGGQWPLMQATATIFLTAAIQANTELSEDEKAHGAEVATQLIDWADPALFTDRERGRQAIAVAVDTARELQLPTLAEARALTHGPAMEKAGIALAGTKSLLRVYGLDLDAMLDGVNAELVSAEGDTATVKVSYPLQGKTVAFEMEMLRRDGAWYGANAIRDAEAELAEAAAEVADAAAPATDGDGAAR